MKNMKECNNQEKCAIIDKILALYEQLNDNDKKMFVNDVVRIKIIKERYEYECSKMN